jgi:hypothetical protein
MPLPTSFWPLVINRTPRILQIPAVPFRCPCQYPDLPHNLRRHPGQLFFRQWHTKLRPHPATLSSTRRQSLPTRTIELQQQKRPLPHQLNAHFPSWRVTPPMVSWPCNPFRLFSRFCDPPPRFQPLYAAGSMIRPGHVLLILFPKLPGFGLSLLRLLLRPQYLPANALHLVVPHHSTSASDTPGTASVLSLDSRAGSTATDIASIPKPGSLLPA